MSIWNTCVGIKDNGNSPHTVNGNGQQTNPQTEKLDCGFAPCTFAPCFACRACGLVGVACLLWTSQDNPISLIAYFPLLPSSSLCFIASSHPRHFASPSFRSCRALAHHVPRFASRLVSSLSVAMSCVSRPSRPAAWSCGRRALRLLNLPAAARCPIRVQDYLWYAKTSLTTL